jgi:hypothetical protein
VKRLQIKRPDVCVVCSVDLPVGADAWWDATARTITCIACESRRPNNAGEPTMIDSGTAGLGAQREYERRVAKRDKAIADKWGTGRVGRFVRFMSDEPPSTTAWKTGGAGEQRLGRTLNERIEGVGVVLHDRRVPGKASNIDHLVVAASGVWVIDAKNWSGMVERRDRGGLFTADERLFVNGRDQTKLLDGVAKQLAAVRTALGPEPSTNVPVRGCLCFVGSDWPLFAKPFRLGGVVVTWPAKLCEAIVEPGPLTVEQVHALARRLSTQLPATGAGRRVRTQSNSGTAATSVDPLDQIERLAALRDRGVLSQEEFEREKRRLLSGDT